MARKPNTLYNNPAKSNLNADLQSAQDELNEIRGYREQLSRGYPRDSAGQPLDRFTPDPKNADLYSEIIPGSETRSYPGGRKRVEFGWRESEQDFMLRGIRDERIRDESYAQQRDRSQVRYATDLKNIQLAESVRRGPKKDTKKAEALIKGYTEAIKGEFDPDKRAELIEKMEGIYGTGRGRGVTPGGGGRAEFKIRGKKQVRFISPSGEPYNPDELANEIMTLDSQTRKKWLAAAQTTMTPDQYDALTERLASFKKGRGPGKPHISAKEKKSFVSTKKRRRPGGALGLMVPERSIPPYIKPAISQAIKRLREASAAPYINR